MCLCDGHESCGFCATRRRGTEFMCGIKQAELYKAEVLRSCKSGIALKARNNQRGDALRSQTLRTDILTICEGSRLCLQVACGNEHTHTHTHTHTHILHIRTYALDTYAHTLQYITHIHADTVVEKDKRQRKDKNIDIDIVIARRVRRERERERERERIPKEKHRN
jgi:hypothetical protein